MQSGMPLRASWVAGMGDYLLNCAAIGPPLSGGCTRLTGGKSSFCLYLYLGPLFTLIACEMLISVFSLLSCLLEGRDHSAMCLPCMRGQHWLRGTIKAIRIARESGPRIPHENSQHHPSAPQYGQQLPPPSPNMGPSSSEPKKPSGLSFMEDQPQNLTRLFTSRPTTWGLRAQKSERRGLAACRSQPPFEQAPRIGVAPATVLCPHPYGMIIGLPYRCHFCQVCQLEFCCSQGCHSANTILTDSTKSRI